MDRETSRVTTALWAAVLAAAALVAYSNALDGPFIFDDRIAITTVGNR